MMNIIAKTAEMLAATLTPFELELLHAELQNPQAVNELLDYLTAKLKHGVDGHE